MVIRPARVDDVVALRGQPFRESMQGVVVERDGVPVGMTGVLHTAPRQAFTLCAEELRKSPRTVVRLARWMLKVLHEQRQPVYAVTDPELPATTRLVQRMGFDYVETTHQGRLWVWAQKQQ